MSLVEGGPELVLLDLEVVSGLQVEPEAGARAEVAGKAQGGVRGDPALAVDDLVDPAGREADRDCQPVLTHAERLEELLKRDLAGVDRVDGGHGHLLVVVDDLDVVGPCVRPGEADPPLLIGPFAVLTGPLLDGATWGSGARLGMLGAPRAEVWAVAGEASLPAESVHLALVAPTRTLGTQRSGREVPGPWRECGCGSDRPEILATLGEAVAQSP